MYIRGYSEIENIWLHSPIKFISSPCANFADTEDVSFFTYGYNCIVALEGSYVFDLSAAPERKSVISSSSFSNSFVVSRSSSSSSGSPGSWLEHRQLNSWAGGGTLTCASLNQKDLLFSSTNFYVSTLRPVFSSFPNSFVSCLSVCCAPMSVCQFILQVFKKYISIGGCIFFNTCSS